MRVLARGHDRALRLLDSLSAGACLGQWGFLG